MRIGIIKDKRYPDIYWPKYEARCKELNLDYRFVNIYQSNWIEDIQDCDGIIWRTGHASMDKFHSRPKIFFMDQHMGKVVHPSWKMFSHYDDKILQSYMFEHYKIPSPKNWVFFNKHAASDFINSYQDWPLVHKLRCGASSSAVSLVKTKEEAIQKTSLMFNKGVIDKWKWSTERDYVYFQEFIPDNDYDIRITTVRNRAFGFIRYNRDNDFRASGSGKLEYDQSLVPEECIKIALEVTKKMGFDTMAYDFVRRPSGEYVIVEISYVFVDKAVYDCPCYYSLEGDAIKSTKGHHWVQHFQVDDMVETIKAREL